MIKREGSIKQHVTTDYLELILLITFINALEDLAGHMVVIFACDTVN